jgi:uncharacterized delta-60 repeat protein
MLAALLASIVFLSAGSSRAAPGSLDPSFGSGGTVTTAVGSGAGAQAIVVQPDGKILLGGFAQEQDETAFALARYGSDGSLDPSFGLGGIVTTGFGPYTYSWIHALALQPDGKIVAAGRVYVARYTPDGRLDSSFGSGGTVYSLPGYVWDVLVQPDGKIIVGGSNRDGLAVARYDPDGALDRGFGSDGIASAPGSYAKALALQPDGKIVAAGVDANAFELARFERDGSLDQTFGQGGHVTAQMDHFDHLEDVALQPNGMIVVAGWTSTLTDWASALARFKADGSLDPSFGSGGRIVTPAPSSFEAFRSVSIQRDGRIVVAGSGDFGFLARRFQPDGSPDDTFGTSGEITTTFRVGAALRQADAYAVAFQPDGKIVAGGQSGDRFALARYLVTPGCVVPDTLGAWLPEARAALRAAGCSLGIVTRIFSRKVGKGFVIWQTPKSGASLPSGEPVDLLVSKGRR